MDASRTCPQCGGSLAGDTPGGQCPQCLLLLGIGEDASGGLALDDDGLGGETAGAGAASFGDAGDGGDPERIGPYRVIERIGEGGMGIVYLAEQETPIRRRVAVKVVKLGMDTAQVIARFESERQALALMSHPNVARVYDAGATPSGRPYFVMEHVPGLPINEFCDATACRSTSGCTSSSTPATPSSTRTRRASSTATSSRPTCWWRARTAARSSR
jgi:hypothetical protein